MARKRRVETCCGSGSEREREREREKERERKRGREEKEVGRGSRQKDILSVVSEMMSAANEFPSRLLLAGASKNKTLLYEQRAALSSTGPKEVSTQFNCSTAHSDMNTVLVGVSVGSQPTQTGQHPQPPPQSAGINHRHTHLTAACRDFL